MSSTTSLLDPRVLARTSNLALLARSVVEGTLTGVHRSPHRGSSVEFAEHKQYVPGDEIRHIDWKAYGKTGKYYVKQFEEETNTRVLIVLDTSGSMGYHGDDRIPKLEYAKQLAASIAYLMLGQSDAVALFASGTSEAFLPPRSASSHLLVICDSLASLEAGGHTTFAEALEHAAEKTRRRSIIVAISDYLEDPEPLGAELRRLRGRGHEVIVFHVVDPDEIDLPFEDPATFVDMEGRPLSVLADPRAIRREYIETMAAHLDMLVSECAGAGIDYARFQNDTPLDIALARFLSWRSFRSSR